MEGVIIGRLSFGIKARTGTCDHFGVCNSRRVKDTIEQSNPIVALQSCLLFACEEILLYVSRNCPFCGFVTVLVHWRQTSCAP